MIVAMPNSISEVTKELLAQGADKNLRGNNRKPSFDYLLLNRYLRTSSDWADLKRSLMADSMRKPSSIFNLTRLAVTNLAFAGSSPVKPQVKRTF